MIVRVIVFVHGQHELIDVNEDGVNSIDLSGWQSLQ
jgi:hypothetical protein